MNEQQSEFPTPLLMHAILEARRAYGIAAYADRVEIIMRNGCKIRLDVPPGLEPVATPERSPSDGPEPTKVLAIRCSADCFVEVLQTIIEVGHRMTRPELLAAMREAGRSRAESTICIALEDMQRLLIVDNRSDVRPRGYGICSWT